MFDLTRIKSSCSLGHSRGNRVKTTSAYHCPYVLIFGQLHAHSLRHSTMDLPLPLTLQCFCGKTFSQQSALTNHGRNCKPSNKRLSSALSLAQSTWEARKKAKRQKVEGVDQVVKTNDTPMVVEEVHTPKVFHKFLSFHFIQCLIGRHDSLVLPPAMF